MSSIEVRFSRLAIQDLDWIWVHAELNEDVQNPDWLVLELVKCCHQIANVDDGLLPEETIYFAPRGCRCFRLAQHVIFYRNRYDHASLEVLRILPAHMMPRHMRLSIY